MSSKISWTNETWNPVIGCSKVSEGCQNCYAEKMAQRLSFLLSEKEEFVGRGYKSVIDRNGKWNSKTIFIDEALEKPLHWKKPRMIFVPSMGDLFHESVPFEWIDEVMEVILQAKQHTYQVLTKRPRQMLKYFQSTNFNLIMGANGDDFGVGIIDNLWLGVTAENQKTANERIPLLLQIPAAVRFLSLEPLLGEIYIDRKIFDWLRWIIIGCESLGGRAGRFQDDFVSAAMDIVKQCHDAGIAAFVKQIPLNGKTCKDINKFPKELQIREYPKKSEK